MGPSFHEGHSSTMTAVSTAYEKTGRQMQKRRTREALVSAARELVAEGEAPTVERAAAAAGISRTTAYRYFTNQHSLLAAAHPETTLLSMLPGEPPESGRGDVHRPDRQDRASTTHHASLVPFGPGATRRAAPAPRPRDRMVHRSAHPARGRAVTGGDPSACARHPQCDRHRGAGVAYRHRGPVLVRDRCPAGVDRPVSSPSRARRIPTVAAAQIAARRRRRVVSSDGCDADFPATFPVVERPGLACWRMPSP
jgi:hypothetical protein